MGNTNSNDAELLRTINLEHPLKIHEAKQIWNSYVTDPNGSMEEKDIKKFISEYIKVQKITQDFEKVFEAFMNTFDINKDGIITFEEITKGAMQNSSIVQGNLRKKKGHMKKGYQAEFTLQENTLSFKNKKGRLKTIVLNNITIESKKNDKAFQLHLVKHKQKKVYFFEAGNLNEKNNWIQAMEKASKNNQYTNKNINMYDDGSLASVEESMSTRTRLPSIQDSEIKLASYNSNIDQQDHAPKESASNLIGPQKGFVSGYDIDPISTVDITDTKEQYDIVNITDTPKDNINESNEHLDIMNIADIPDKYKSKEQPDIVKSSEMISFKAKQKVYVIEGTQKGYIGIIHSNKDGSPRISSDGQYAVNILRNNKVKSYWMPSKYLELSPHLVNENNFFQTLIKILDGMDESKERYSYMTLKHNLELQICRAIDESESILIHEMLEKKTQHFRPKQGSGDTKVVYIIKGTQKKQFGTIRMRNGKPIIDKNGQYIVEIKKVNGQMKSYWIPSGYFTDNFDKLKLDKQLSEPWGSVNTEFRDPRVHAYTVSMGQNDIMGFSKNRSISSIAYQSNLNSEDINKHSKEERKGHAYQSSITSEDVNFSSGLGGRDWRHYPTQFPKNMSQPSIDPSSVYQPCLNSEDISKHSRNSPKLMHNVYQSTLTSQNISEELKDLRKTSSDQSPQVENNFNAYAVSLTSTDLDKSPKDINKSADGNHNAYTNYTGKLHH